MKKFHSKENKMSFIYYVLVLMFSYTGPVYAEISVAPNENQKEAYEVYAKNDIVVGELPSGKIRIYTDRSQTTTVELDKQDCDIMRKKDNTVGLGFKFGGLMWGFGPEIQIGHSSGVAWKGDVQRMVAEYQELCTQFNTGRLSQEEYKFEKKGIIQRGYGYAKELEKRFKQKKNDMFKEMDQGKYISLQNGRFYEGCCVTNDLLVPDYKKEKRMLAEREIKIRDQELTLRERQLAQREKLIVTYVQPKRVLKSRPYYRNNVSNNSLNNFISKRQRNSRVENHHWDSLMNRRSTSRNNNVAWNINMGGRW